MPSLEQSATFLPPLPPVSPVIPSSTHPSKSVVSMMSKHRRMPNAKASERPPIAARGDNARDRDQHPKKVVYVEPLQNATSRRILCMYYQQQPAVPVDWRNGLDMRTLAPAQDPGYLVPRQTNTYETNVKSKRPYYEGGVLNQLRHGQGKCQFRNAAFSYEGEWNHGRVHGHGKLQLPDGFYEGEFRNGEITGSGTKCWHNGDQYTGEFLDGELHGQGLFLRADGERYEGGFLRNQRSGQGVLVMSDGTRYDGCFEEHRLNGYATMEHSSGDRYQGDWCNGNMDGVGEYLYANGDHYVGRYARNLREGKGWMFLAASGIKLDCKWERNLPVLLPVRLSAESPDLLFYKPPTPPPPKEPPTEGVEEGVEAPGGEGGEGEGEEGAAEVPPPPPSLKDVLAAPLAPGSMIPPLIVTVEGLEGAGHAEEDGQAKLGAQTPGDNLAGTNPVLGESGRLLNVTFGVFEREQPPNSDTPVPDAQEPAENPLGLWENYAREPHALIYQPPTLAPRTPTGKDGEEGEEGAAQGDAPPADDASRPDEAASAEGVAGAAQEEGVEEEEDGAKQLCKMMEGGPKLPFARAYPPDMCIGGFKVVDGRVRIEGLRLPETLAAGVYQLRIGANDFSQLPWEAVQPVYLEITVG